MPQELSSLTVEGLQTAYIDESQKFVIALKQGASSTQLADIRNKMKLIMELIDKREREKNGEL